MDETDWAAVVEFGFVDGFFEADLGDVAVVGCFYPCTVVFISWLLVLQIDNGINVIRERH